MRGSLVRVQQDPMLERWLTNTYYTFLINPALFFFRKIHPLWITLLATISGICAAIAIHTPLLALLLMVLSGYFDSLDGAIARSFHKQSKAGAACDIISDRIVESSIIIALFTIDHSRAIFCLMMLASVLICITSFLVVAIFSANNSSKSFYYSPGLIERPEAFCFFAAMLLLPSLFIPLAIMFTLAVFATAFIRLFAFIFSNK